MAGIAWRRQCRLVNKLGSDRYYAWRNRYLWPRGLFEHEFVFRGRWLAVSMNGIWYRRQRLGSGWAFIWSGEGLANFKRRADGRVCGPIPIVPAWRPGSFRRYLLDPVEDI